MTQFSQTPADNDDFSRRLTRALSGPLRRLEGRVRRVELRHGTQVARGHEVFTFAALPANGQGTTTRTGMQVVECSDCRKSGEGGGAGTGVPVWDDGTDWRTFYDNSVAAN